MQPDSIDLVLEKWAREWPDLDVSPLAVISRITRAGRLLNDRIDENFETQGLTGWSYRLLATLRHTPAPRLLTPTALSRALMLTSGAITKQLDQLELAGLVERRPDPSDRRGALIGLTEQGRTVIDAVIVSHIATEHALLQGLEPAERELLAMLLKQLLRSLGDHADPPD